MEHVYKVGMIGDFGFDLIYLGTNDICKCVYNILK